MTDDLVTVPREQLERMERALADHARRIAQLEAAVEPEDIGELVDPVADTSRRYMDHARQRELAAMKEKAGGRR